MKTRIGVLLVFFAFTVSHLFSDESTNDVKRKALQFCITDLIELSGLNGSMLSMKDDYSDNRSILFGISVGGASDKYTAESTYTYGSSSRSIDENSYHANVAISISCFHQWYLTQSRPARLYIGLGINGYGSYVLRDEKRSSSDGYVQRQAFTEVYGFGIAGCCDLGIEWCFSRDFSLFAQFRNNIKYGRSFSYRQNEDDIENSDDTIISLVPVGVMLGMSVYF